jgi:hypothetical protein
MLIDCGVFTGTAGGSARMKKIAEDIKEATGGILHVLVGTHEHFDHLSGFGFSGSRQVFDEIEVKEVWVAWTEDPAHPLAKKLREELNVALRALRRAIQRFDASGDPRGPRIGEVLAFLSEGDEVLGVIGTKKQFDYVRGKGEALRFRRPGESPITLPGVQGVRVFVLGPPEDEGLLKRSNPSETDSEVYEIDPHMGFYSALLRSAFEEEGEPGLATAGDDEELGERSMPFHGRYRIEFEEQTLSGEQRAFFRRHYGFSKRRGHGPSWRRIDLDWLAAAESIALKLDNHVNNTSLALAIELVDTGKVLLFPADAQVGNWLSWHDVTWPGLDCGNDVTGTDLVERTVLYKVGHHGSHNATLRGKGLELMESSELVAMIPVDEDQADGKKWKMPFEPLYKRLKEKTRGRVIRADDGLPSAKPPGLSEGEWDEFKKRTKSDPSGEKLWIEYNVPG